MRTLFVITSVAIIAAGGLAGCRSAATSDVVVGDCLETGGPPDRPEARKVPCGTAESNYKVVAVVEETDECPTDVDSYYSMGSSFSDSRTTVCLDIDWVVGGCMSIARETGEDPVRTECDDTAVPGRQRATQILDDVASADLCASGLGYAYDERDFTVCVEDVA